MRRQGDTTKRQQRGTHRSEPRLIRVSSFPEPSTPVPPPARSGKREPNRTRPARATTVRREWTDEEDRYLRKQYARQGAPACAKHLGRNRSSVQHRAQRLGIRSKRSRLWTAKEDLLLRRQYPKIPAARLAKMLKRTMMSVRQRLMTLGLTAEGNASWTAEELAYLRAHAGTASHAVLGAELGRTKSAVQLKISRLGLKKAPPPLSARTTRAIVKRLGTMAQTDIARELGISANQVHGVARKQGYIERPTSRPWTAEDEAELRRLFPTMTHAELAQALDRTLESINVRTRSLGLYRKGPNATPRKR